MLDICKATAADVHIHRDGTDYMFQRLTINRLKDLSAMWRAKVCDESRKEMEIANVPALERVEAIRIIDQKMSTLTWALERAMSVDGVEDVVNLCSEYSITDLPFSPTEITHIIAELCSVPSGGSEGAGPKDQSLNG